MGDRTKCDEVGVERDAVEEAFDEARDRDSDGADIVEDADDEEEEEEDEDDDEMGEAGRVGRVGIMCGALISRPRRDLQGERFSQLLEKTLGAWTNMVRLL